MKNSRNYYILLLEVSQRPRIPKLSFPERRMILNIMNFFLHPLSFRLQKVLNGFAERRVNYPMRAVSFGRHITSRQFMVTLSSGFYSLQTIMNSIFDCLVVTNLKVKELIVCITSPITTIKCFFSNKIQGTSNRLPLFFSYN